MSKGNEALLKCIFYTAKLSNTSYTKACGCWIDPHIKDFLPIAIQHLQSAFDRLQFGEKVRGEKLFNITNPQKSPFDDISQIPRVLFFISLLEMLAFAQMVEQKTLFEAIVVLILQREVYVCTYMRPLFEVTTRTQILVSSSSKYIDNLKQIFCGFQSIGFRMLHLILYDLSPLFGNTCVLCYSRIKVFMK